MAPALSTSKRKFYKLLDALSTSNSSVTNEVNKKRLYTTRNDKSTSPALGFLDTITLNSDVDERPAKRWRISSNAINLSKKYPSLLSPTSASKSSNNLSNSTFTQSINRRHVKPADSASHERSTLLNTTSREDDDTRFNLQYSPWSTELFLLRLKTFSDVKTWPPKPDSINEVQWAKRGWTCQGFNTVACRGGCEAHLVIILTANSLPLTTLDPTASQIKQDVIIDEPDPNLIKMYEGLIISKHHDSCLWKRAGCRDSIYHIRMGEISAWKAELTLRYTSLLSVKHALPSVLNLPRLCRRAALTGSLEANEEIEQLTVDHFRDIVWLTGCILSESQTLPPLPFSVESLRGKNMVNKNSHFHDVACGTALILAIFGWNGQLVHNLPMITCSFCFSRVGLWLFANSTMTARPTTDGELAVSTWSNGTNSGGYNDDTSLRLDPRDFHREYCPWINAQTQNSLGKFKRLAGWEILVELIRAQNLRLYLGQTDSQVKVAASDYEVEQGDCQGMLKTGYQVEDVAVQRLHDQQRESRLRRIRTLFRLSKLKV